MCEITLLTGKLFLPQLSVQLLLNYGSIVCAAVREFCV